MLHHERIRPPHDDYTPDEWNLIEKAFHPEFVAQTESLFALSNGYLGMRGVPEEGEPSVQNGTFINGFYEEWPIVYSETAYGFARTGQTMLNVTDSKIIRLFVDDEPFSVTKTNIRHYDRRLNLKAGTLDRELHWETPSGKLVRIRTRRLVSFRHRHVAAITYEVTLLNQEAPVVISSEMHCHTPEVRKTDDDPRRAKMFTGDVLGHRASYMHDSRVVLAHGTERSRMIVACGIDHQLETDCQHSRKTSHNENFGQVAFSVAALPGKSIHLTKFIAYHTAAIAKPESLCDRVEWTLDRTSARGFTTLLKEQQDYLGSFWHRSDVSVSNIDAERARLTTVEIQQAIRVNLFHILQASARAETTGVAAKGLTGQAYEGQYFWDTEIYLLPFLIYTSPRIAKNLLRFRYGMLDHARARARELGHRGALFPWRTISGEEASAYYAAGTAQYHINADIMYALRKYVNATGDQEFLLECGAEMLVETARLWYALGFFSKRKGGKFCINGVTGPDEYNTVVNNNTYTNLMARENLRYAADTVSAIKADKPHILHELIKKTGLDLAEVDMWTRAADNMYVPFEAVTGIYPQDDGFLDRQPWDFDNTPADRYPLLLFYHPLNIYRSQVIKQADVILAMFLLSHEFSADAKRRNFDFYDPLTTGDSSLSSCIEAIVALEVGEFDKAVSYMRAALLMDLADVGGNVTDGCHIASMGGTWTALVYGFGGLRDYDGMLSFRPQRPPEGRSTLRFALTYRGRALEVEIAPDSTTYTMRVGDELVFRHEDEAITLTHANPTAVRRTLRP
jgi:alpha,alpha-trehalose phosphorylase